MADPSESSDLAREHKLAEIEKLKAEKRKVDLEALDVQRRQGISGKLLAIATPLIAILVAIASASVLYVNFFEKLHLREVRDRELDLKDEQRKVKDEQRKLLEAQDRFSTEERALLNDRDELARQRQSLEQQRDQLQAEKQQLLSKIDDLKRAARTAESQKIVKQLEQLRLAVAQPQPEETPRADSRSEVPVIQPETDLRPAPTENSREAIQKSDPHPAAEAPRERSLTDLLSRFSQKDFYVGAEIPPAKLQFARQAAHVPADEPIVALLIAEVLGPPNNVILFGRDRLYYNHQRYNQGSIPYAELPSLRFATLPFYGVDLGNGNYFNLAGSRVSPDTLIRILTMIRDSAEDIS